jgi:hypothetical protein
MELNKFKQPQQLTNCPVLTFKALLSLIVGIACIAVFIGYSIAPIDGLVYVILVIPLIGAMLIIFHLDKTISNWIKSAILWFVIFGLWLVYPAISCTLRDEYRYSLLCENHLRTIALAMQQYQARYGEYPPPWTTDKNGRPLMSWRVLLLPYLSDDGDVLYKQLHLDEPWNSPHNRRCFDAVKDMKHYFRCPAAFLHDENADETNYLMVLRKNNVKAAPSIDGKNAGAAVFLIETRNSGVPWPKPGDIEADHITGKFNEEHQLGIGSFHRSLANVLLLNGEVHDLPFSMSPVTVKNMLDGTTERRE